jgi:hypothetical protein
MKVTLLRQFDLAKPCDLARLGPSEIQQPTEDEDAAAMMEPADSPSLDMVTAALRADSSDIAIYAKVLTESLGDALPANCVTIDRNRSMSDRIQGRPGAVSKITVRLGEQVMTLRLTGGAPNAEICREVRGVVLSRQPVQVGQWAAELAKALVSHAEQNAQTAEALRRLVAGS